MRNSFPWLRKLFGRHPGKGDVDHQMALAEKPAVPAQGLISLLGELERLVPRQAEQLLAQLCKGLHASAGDEVRYRAAEVLATAVYPTYKFSEYGRLFLEDQAFLAYYQRFMDPDNWHSLDRKYTLDQLLRLVAHVDGDLAECGTYKGFSAYRMCHAARNTGRLVHLFDSFDGLSTPGQWDGGYWTTGALRVPEAALRETLVEFDNYRVYRGWIPERFTEVSDQRFSFVHIDVDLYQPTLDSLEFFYPRTCREGIILMDDYGFATCPGAKRAADEFFKGRAEPIVMLTTGQALVLKR
ncbi:MAG TPA: TylF/MycF/NovP-related O-methyltransferase [Gammaproteobacteria bacterium]|nr:TylF/MycF/NovP-related O-methyltransferase [Gammaproteobacteria bacterium]